MKGNYSDIEVIDTNRGFDVTLDLLSKADGIAVYNLKLHADETIAPQKVTLKWTLPCVNVKGVWKSGVQHDKRIQYDWELEHLQSRISVDAPVLSLFGYNDENVMTIACSDAINMIEMNSLLREENNLMYCHISFFNERHPEITDYEAQIRIDTRGVNYDQALMEVSAWWETYEAYKPAAVPALARMPLYSTWYQFHQDMSEDVLISECKIAKELGYELIIIDDGWQTMDTNRGYDYTGDWQPDRFSNMSKLVEDIHQVGMKVGIWFSVPFCGKKSKAYKKFSGKFLAEDHRWAPVLDPRYPEVREHLVNIYSNALRDWNLDAFKLDFIDDFKVYETTDLSLVDGRDYASVNDAVHRLMSDVAIALYKIKPDVAIEFRQKYIGPAMRKFGNMFRAFDCPNDPVSNRIRIVDVKLLCGSSAVHSDMLKWHPAERVEVACLQLLNSLFGVPQMSMLLEETSEEHIKMIKHYNQYWIDNSTLFLDGNFRAHQPLANYPILSVSNKDKRIVALYEEMIADIDGTTHSDIINATRSEQLVIRVNEDIGNYKMIAYDCLGVIQGEEIVDIQEGVSQLYVPSAGMVTLTKVD